MSIDFDLSQAEYRALAEFRYQLRRFLHFSEQEARTAGLEQQQHQLLLAVRGLPSGKMASVGELAERLQLQHHSTVELIDRMVGRGLLERQRDPNDQRRVLIYLTRNGDELLKRLSLVHLTELRTTGPTLVQALNALIEG
jgi:DNA-binding MarR family transcriptional regulator